MDSTFRIKPHIYVVDDDETVRQSIAFLLGILDVEIVQCAQATEFIDAYRPGIPGCLLLDVRMPGMSGLELQDRLDKQQIDLPIIFISGHGDIPMVVRTMRKGALDFLQKPFNDQELLDRVQQAIDQDKQRLGERREEVTLVARHQLLTPRERDVMELILQGMTNKVVAQKLSISQKTVESHRARVMEKMQADSLASLMLQWQVIERAQHRNS
jgi:RNA polymerase sigma factor (sigma-70 family)